MEDGDPTTVPSKRDEESTGISTMGQHGFARSTQQGNPLPTFLDVGNEPKTSSECDQVDSSELICMHDGDSQEDLADCSTREHSPEPMHVSDNGYEDADINLQCDKRKLQDENTLVEDDLTRRRITDLNHPDTSERPLDKPNCHSVEVQVSIEKSDTQEFNFTCSWERTGTFSGSRNAIVQCNLSKGWCIGVPKVNFIPPSTLPPKWSSKPAATVMHRKPVPIIVKDKTKQYGRNKVEHILFSRSIGVQCQLTPRRGYNVSSKGVQAFLPISCYNNLSYLLKEQQSAPVSKLPVQLSDSITITKVTPDNRSEDEESFSTSSIQEPDVNINSVHTSHKGFRGFDSIEDSKHSVTDLVSLSGFGTTIFQLLLKKLDVSGNITPLMSNKSVLLMFLMKLNLGIQSSALGVLFGLDETTTLDLVLTALRILRTRVRNSIYMPSQATISNELPSYFRGVYKKVRIIIVCAEFVVEEPKSEAERVKYYSDTRGTGTFKVFIGMTPLGKVCFKSKPYRGQTSFGAIIKECNIVAHLECGEVVLAESLLPEMQLILQKGVLVVVPSAAVEEEESSSKTLRDSGDVFGVEVRKHVEKCTRRLTSVKLMREIPCSMFPYITELLYVWYSIINQMPPILRHDQPD